MKYNIAIARNTINVKEMLKFHKINFFNYNIIFS